MREEAARLLGAAGPNGAPRDEAVPLLEKALADAEWGVAVVAAVSLGKTRSLKAIPLLERLIDPKTVKDWRLRGAAVAGLGGLRQRGAVPGLIVALEDKDPAVSRTAYECLQRLTTRPMRAQASTWSAWWAKAGPTYVFADWDKLSRTLGRGGYAVSLEDVYKDVGPAKQDVVVLPTSNMNSERLFGAAGVGHRVVRESQQGSLDLHPFAVILAGDNAAREEAAMDRLRWFVRTGGHLFVSCVQAPEVFEPLAPARVRALAAKSPVSEPVFPEPCPGESPWMQDVFSPFARPIYGLRLAALIEVLQPERVEVLIDSPDCATRWGGGNLACWFQLGHGIILDTSNLFSVHELLNVGGLKSGLDRMAYAMDHMGVDYEEARRLAERKVWDSQTEATKAVHDFSPLRLLTNFVRFKRRNDP